MRGELGDVGGVEDADDPEHAERQGEEDDRREAPLRTQCLDLPTDAVAVADGRVHVVEHLGEVATDLPVDLDRLDDPVEVL